MLMFWSRKEPPALDFLDAREYFIPVRFPVIRDAVLEEPCFSAEQREDLKTFAQMLEEHYHYDYHAAQLALEQAFAPFNPDLDTVWEPEVSPEDLESCRSRLMAGVLHLLKVGNYRLLSEEEFNRCLELQPFSGLSVTVGTDAFEEFHVYYRGVRTTRKTLPVLYLWKTHRETRELKRVFVLARYKEKFGHKILAKMFRDVPVENLKIIAPEVKLSLPMFDRFKIGGTVFGSIFMPLYKLLIAAALSWWIFFTFLTFFIMALVKGVLGFFNSRIRCLQVYSSSLYHQILANNIGAISRLTNQAEAQEVKEAFLAYVLLYRNCKAMTEAELDAKVEAWLEEKFHYAVDFEVHDALEKLRKKRLVEAFPGENGETLYRVYSIQSALRRLDEIWDSIHMNNNDGSPDDDVLVMSDRCQGGVCPPWMCKKNMSEHGLS